MTYNIIDYMSITKRFCCSCFFIFFFCIKKQCRFNILNPPTAGKIWRTVHAHPQQGFFQSPLLNPPTGFFSEPSSPHRFLLIAGPFCRSSGCNNPQVTDNKMEPEYCIICSNPKPYTVER